MLDLVDGSVSRMVELKLALPTSSSLGISGASSAILSLVRQFNYQCWLADIAAGNHNEVGITLAGGVFTVDDILVPCPYICH